MLSVTPSAANGFITNTASDYDLYYFDQTGGENDMAWKNYKQKNFDLVSGKGYLYANKKLKLTKQTNKYRNKMKKLTLTLAIVLGMMIGANAQESEYRGERGLFGMGSEAGGWFGGRGVLEELALPDAHGLEDDANASPLGSGLFVLAGLGAAYLVGKKRREE